MAAELRLPNGPANEGSVGSAGGTDLGRKLLTHAVRLLALAQEVESNGSGAALDATRLAHWHGLLELVVDAYPSVPRSALAAPEPLAFRREGEYWTVGPTPHVRLRDSKGMRYLSMLLARPGQEVHALDLARLGAEAAVDTSEIAGSIEGLVTRSESALPSLDAAASAAYRSRLGDLRAELDGPDRLDPERRASLMIEADWLASELASAHGLGGRLRPGPSASERARQSVSKAIRVAIDRIEGADATVGTHLAKAVRTGTFCCYDVDPAAGRRWLL
jgi:hypothetical protein